MIKAVCNMPAQLAKSAALKAVTAVVPWTKPAGGSIECYQKSTVFHFGSHDVNTDYAKVTYSGENVAVITMDPDYDGPMPQFEVTPYGDPADSLNVWELSVIFISARLALMDAVDKDILKELTI